MILESFLFIILFYTLMEMKEQRISVYQPMLIIQSHNFLKFHWEDTINEPGDFHCYLRDEPFDTSKFMHDTRMKILNIGLASAKNIKICWDFDFNFF